MFSGVALLISLKNFFFAFTSPICEYDTSRSGEDTRKGCKRVNIVEILCTYVCKFENEIY
jgi:hypothetical protein